MAENTWSGLQSAVARCASGPSLLAALQAGNLANSELPGLISACIQESCQPAKAAAPVVGAQPGPGGPLQNVLLSSVQGLMFLTPRGKHELAFLQQEFVIRTPKGDLAVPYTAIRHLAIFDSIPKDTKGRVLLYLHLASEPRIMNGKTPLTAVVIQTQADAALSIPHPRQQGEQLAGPAAVVLCQAFGVMGLEPSCFCSPDEDVFSSTTSAAGVEAFVKARQGFLFPMPTALCFLESPPLFIPTSDVRSVELARAGGTASTFDLYVHLYSGTTHEFSNLPRAEVGPIDDYIRKARLAVGSGDSSGEEASGAEEEGEAAESDSDDPEDEDFAPSSEDEEGEPGGAAASKKRKRGGGGGSKGAAAAEGGAAAAHSEGGAEAAGGGSSDEDSDEDQEEDGEEEEEEDKSSSEGSGSDSEGSVELVSEDEFSTEQLRSMVESEGGGKRRRAQ